MTHQLKVISKAGIPEAISKAELYRCINEPEEAESICHDILAIDPGNQLALRMLGLAITDQFTGAHSDRYAEVQGIFEQLTDPYERWYYLGLLHERRAKVQLRAGRPPHTLHVLFEEAMRCFEEAERLRPKGNDDSILRWNRCVRLLHSHPAGEAAEETIDIGDSKPY
jgi:tetratricopeptide (TPR) repeat protein